ncbi:MAG: zinc-dependent metalloprotease [Cyclobacteriaceae bacterium]
MRRGIIFFVWGILVVNRGFAQVSSCGTVATERDIQAMSQLSSNFDIAGRTAESEIINIAITAHVVRSSDGGGGLSSGVLTSAISNLNIAYAPVGINFFLLNSPRFIDDDTHFNFFSSQEDGLAANNVKNTVNIYFVNSASVSGGNFVCGYAYFPAAKKDLIIMANGCTGNGATLAHELGHFFALYHTHGKVNNGTTDELVSRENCESAGDDLCDTPADPQLSNLVNSSCQYTGGAQDSNGDFYTPDVENFMSYSLSQCRDSFTDGQIKRMGLAYKNFKSHILQNDPSFEFAVDEFFVANATCPDKSDGSVQVQVSRAGEFLYSTDGLSFIASNQLTGLAPGTHQIFVKNEVGSVSTSTVEVGFVTDYPEIPTIELVNNQLVIQVEDGHEVNWYFENSFLEGETGPSLDSPSFGSYTVGVSNGGCETLSEVFEVLSTDEIESNLSFYPNPTVEILNVSLQPSLHRYVESVTIRDLGGRVTVRGSLTEAFNVSTLKPGLYLLELTGSNFVVRRRFLKR